MAAGLDSKARAVMVLIVAVLIILGVGTRYLLEKDREALVDHLSHDRAAQIDALGDRVAGAIDEVSDDLNFTGHLLLRAADESERRDVSLALMGSVRAYRALGLYRPDGTRDLLIGDPKRPPMIEPPLVAAMDKVAAETLRELDDRLEASVTIAGEDGRWFRVFATDLRSGDAGAGALVVAVDTTHFLDSLGAVAADPQAELVVLGPTGALAPISSHALRTGLEGPAAERPKLAALLRAMRTGEAGTERLTAADAEALGLTAEERIIAYGPIQLSDGGRWSLATMNSLEVVRAQERTIMWRMGSMAVLVALLVLGSGIYLITSMRRQAVLVERLRHAREIGRLHELADTILDTIPTGVAVLDEEGLVADLNGTLLDQLGEQALGEPLDRVFPKAPPEVVAQLADLVEAASRHRGRQTMLVRDHTLFDGEAGHYLVHAVALEQSTPEAHTLLVIEDSTSLRRLEEQLLRAEKLSTVGVLSAGIAHEVGTPLGVIRGRAEYLMRKLGDDSPHRDGLQTIVEQIDRVSRIIRELLDFARVSPADSEPVELEPLAGRVVDLLAFELAKRHLEIKVDVAPGLPRLDADGDELQQVLINLLVNAADACADGGHIAVAARLAGPGEVVVEVSDDGTGIPHELQHQIFDPFFTTKKRGKGTGLGLAVVAQIVRNHAGRIELDSEPGVGTTIRVYWPVARGPGVRRNAAA